MLLQSTCPRPSFSFHLQNHFFSLSSLSFSDGYFQNSAFSLEQPDRVVSVSGTPKNSVFKTCSSISQVHSYGTVDYEKRPMLDWKAIYKKISMMNNPDVGAAFVLNLVENEGKKFTKWELCRIVKELRKFRRFKYALQVYEWLNNRAEYYRITSSDTAIQLDLIAKVHGIASAEQYFLKLPDVLKDRRIYGALLNAYVRARLKEKAESQMDKMRSRGYAGHALPFNVMMTLYMNLNAHEKVESLVMEMAEKNIPLDIYTYNIWLAACGAQGSIEKMEQAFDQMQLNPRIIPNWTTFSTMATIYIKLKCFEKAEDCLKKIESKITGRDRMPYHYLISLYGNTGNKDELYRIWGVYKDTFSYIPNSGYHAFISSVVRLDDIESAEKIYADWLIVKSVYDPRVGNLLLSSYVKKGLSEKAQTFFDQIFEVGGEPNSMTWEILAEDHIRNRKIPEALSCLRNAASAEGAKNWRPRPANISSILKIIEQEADLKSKDSLFEVLGQVGCLDDANYMSFISIFGGEMHSEGVTNVEYIAVSDNDEGGAYPVLNELQERL